MRCSFNIEVGPRDHDASLLPLLISTQWVLRNALGQWHGDCIRAHHVKPNLSPAHFGANVFTAADPRHTIASTWATQLQTLAIHELPAWFPEFEARENCDAKPGAWVKESAVRTIKISLGGPIMACLYSCWKEKIEKTWLYVTFWFKRLWLNVVVAHALFLFNVFE